MLTAAGCGGVYGGGGEWQNEAVKAGSPVLYAVRSPQVCQRKSMELKRRCGLFL